MNLRNMLDLLRLSFWKNFSSKSSLDRNLLFLCGILAVLIGGFIWKFIHISPEDGAAYHQLMQMSDSTQTKEEPTSYRSHQQRVGVSKQIFLQGRGDTLEVKLKSESSDLLMDFQHGRSEVVEKFENAKLFMQEEVYYLLSDGRQGFKQSNGHLLLRDADPSKPASWIKDVSQAVPMQTIRFLEAKRAQYSYQSGCLFAEGVKLARYSLPGNRLSESQSGAKIVMGGTADTIEFSLHDNDFQLNAQKFKVSLVDEEPVEIESREAACRTREITLRGDVSVQHEIGKLFAQQIRLVTHQQEKKGRFSTVELVEGARIHWSDGGVLHCDEALIDCQSLKGTFYSYSGKEVVYAGVVGTKPMPLVIKGKAMSVELKREKASLERKKTSISIAAMQAEGDVVMNYAQDYTILADQAVYQCVQRDSFDQKIAGIITVNMNSSDLFCTVFRGEKDKILAKAITVDTMKKKISFLDAKGELSISPSRRLGNVIEFFTNHLLWEDQSQKLIMSGDVSIYQKGLGKLVTQDQVELTQHLISGKREVKSIFFPGNTVLSYMDVEKSETHTLICHGPLTVDHEHLKVVMECPKDEMGRFLEDKQVFFEDQFGKIYADKAMISYAWREGQMEMQQIILEGNVHILSYQKKKESPELQYAMADKIEYTLLSKEMVFSSQKGRRVLLYDAVNHMQISAPALRVQRDQLTKKDSIQGVGDVRFSFVENEFEQLQQRFRFSQEPDSEKPLK